MFGRKKIESDGSEFLLTDNLILQTNDLFVRTDKVIAIYLGKRDRERREMEREREKSERE